MTSFVLAEYCHCLVDRETRRIVKPCGAHRQKGTWEMAVHGARIAVRTGVYDWIELDGLRMLADGRERRVQELEPDEAYEA